MDNSLHWNVADSLDDGTAEDNLNNADLECGRIGTIFLIECSQSMFEKQEDGSESFFELSLRAIKELILKLIRRRLKSLVGVVFYGTVSKDKSTNPDSITTFLEVKEPSADSILKIEETLELSPRDFEKEYGFSPTYSIGDGLWHCTSLLRNCGFKLRSQTIVLGTCNDDPFSDSTVKQHHVRTRARDLKTDHVNFELLPFGENFDTSKFYREILQIFSETDVVIPRNIECLDDILPQVLVEDSKPRTFGYMKFFLKKDLSFAVSAFKLYSKAVIPSVSKVDRMHNKPVKTVTNYREAETDDVMLPSELAKQVTMADEKIQFSEAELKRAKAATANYGFQLLGFKPAEAFKFYHYSQSPLFIIPSEKVVKGSEQLFVTLRDCLLERNKVALCYLTARSTSASKLVYLIPQKEQITDGIQTMPDGFHVIFLPFAEQIREVPLPDGPEVSPELKAVTEKMIKKLTIKYNPAMFQNPKLATFWAGLEALALNRNEVEEIEDSSNPDPEHTDNRLEGISEEFNHYFEYDEGPSKATAKRSASSSKQTAPKKKK